MGVAGDVTIDLDMAFPTAGVGFTVRIRPGEADAGASLGIELRSMEAAKQARFRHESSYALADFVGGFCRWLGTKGITASHTDEAITGRFRAPCPITHMLATAQELCQMLDDKFGAYPHSILS